VSSTGTSTWDWQIFCQSTLEKTRYSSCFGEDGDITYLQWLFSAWGWTLAVSALALLIGLVFGITVGIARTAPNKWVAFLANAWTELFRNIPVLLQVLLWYHVVPVFFPALRGLSNFVLAVMALGFFTSSRIAVQVKAGIETLPQGQRYAGLAIGLSLAQTYRYVLLPRAFRIIIPPLTSESMNIIKNSSVAFVISVAELTMFARQAQEETSRGIEIYLAVTALYFISGFTVNRLALWLDKRFRVPGMTGGV
jgi:glutamate/aspartate transport system permease protein